MSPSRRSVLSLGALTGSSVVLGSAASAAAGAPVPRDQRETAAATPLPADPFTLGIASGDPSPDGFVIWTRLALDPVAEDGAGGMPASTYAVRYQVATSSAFADTEVVRSGEAAATPEGGHAVHVELEGLDPGRPYWYRFAIDSYVSTTGLSRTAPALDALVPLTMAFVSCQKFSAGYYAAYRDLAAQSPDLVLHLGDYIYEAEQETDDTLGRAHLGPETSTLAQYRRRYGQYKSDLDLQAAHAAAPWVVVWDDHELDDNWAGDFASRPEEQAAFPARRTAAFQAYYENMPLRRTSVPNGLDLQLYRRLHWGRMATFHMLDTRQYRDDQACGDAYQPDCAAADDPSRTMLGAEQEAWLLDGFRGSTAQWDLLGQQMFFGQRDTDPGTTRTTLMDAWDGYRPSRDRVVQGWQDAGVRNPVVLTGDVHAHWAGEVVADYDDPDSPSLGSELVTSSISSGGNGYDDASGQHPWAEWNPQLRFWNNLRGYVSTTITADSLTADFRSLRFVRRPLSQVFSRRTYVLEDGVRGLQLVSDNPVPVEDSLLDDRPSDEEIIRDTIREETQGS